MKLATIRRDGDTVAVRVDEEGIVEIPGFPDVGALLREVEWRTIASAAAGRFRPIGDVPDDAWAPVVTEPRKIVCVGVNYRAHIEEMGREVPDYPTLFTKYPESLIGAGDPIVLPPHAAEMVDWEAELAIVIGSRVRRADEQGAAAAIAGYTVLNDVSMRDWQNRTLQWLQGKSFESSTPIGPVLATTDEVPASARITTEVDGELLQDGRIDDLVFGAGGDRGVHLADLPARPGRHHRDRHSRRRRARAHPAAVPRTRTDGRDDDRGNRVVA